MWLPPFFFADSNNPCKDLLFLHGPNLAQNPLYLVGTILEDDFQSVLCTLESLFAVFCFVSCKTSQNVNISQLLIQSKFRTTVIMDVKPSKLYALFFPTSLDELCTCKSQ